MRFTTQAGQLTTMRTARSAMFLARGRGLGRGAAVTTGSIGAAARALLPLRRAVGQHSGGGEEAAPAAELRYSSCGTMWVARAEIGLYHIGLTAAGVDGLGEIGFLDLHAPGLILSASQPGRAGSFGMVEGTGGLRPIASPISGEVVLVNTALLERPSEVGVAAAAASREAWLVQVDSYAESEAEEEEWQGLLQAAPTDGD